MDATVLTKHKVYDIPLRIMHASLALCVVGLAATGWASDLFEDGGPVLATLWSIHFFMGRVLAVTLATRLVWGVLGPLHARWEDMWHPKVWMETLRARWPTRDRLGHDVMASAAYLAVYSVVFMMVGTGMAMEGVEHGSGPLGALLFERVALGEWLEEPHEAGAALAVGFGVLHVVAMLWHQVKERRPVLQAMLSGYQFRRQKES